MVYIDSHVSNYLHELYQLLEERPQEANISHKRMPTFDEHRYFVMNHPYLDWIIIKDDDQNVVGSVYLTKAREIGVSIFKKYQGNGHGKTAIDIIRAKYPGPLYANIAPNNEKSKAFFLSLGFELIQHTYKLQG